MLAACTRDEGFRYMSPDGATDLIVQPKRADGPAAGAPNEVFLGRVTPEEPATAEPERVLVGAFVGGWSPASIAWVDATTVNVCPLAGRRGVKTHANVLVKSDGARRLYRVTTDCAKQRRAPRLPPYDPS